MLDGSSHLRLSRRSALQMVTALAAAALVPLGSTASAQSGGDSRPGSETRPGSQPANNADPAPSTRFSSPAVPGPSPQPGPAGQPAPAPPGPADSSNTAAPSAQARDQRWIQNHHATELWSGPDEKAVSFGWAPAFSYFRVLGAQEGSRIRIQNPLTNGVAFVTAKDVGPSGSPPEWYLSQKSQLSIPGRIVGGANIRRSPAVEDGNIVGHAGHNEGVGVIGEVKGSDGEIWYRVGPNELVHGSLVRMPSKVPPHPGKLIVAELADPCIVTAYEDGKAVYSTLALKGTSGWGTPTGFFTILRRVANETMSSDTLGIPRDAPGGWHLKDVLFTQYFTNDGASIHYNYWSSNWGYSGSHGCLGMGYDDSLWFWEWAEVGTPLAIQE
jgi:lipoprotein-anchoring transpeptidase ErfK/SrfK